jgi:hypothetical protein
MVEEYHSLSNRINSIIETRSKFKIGITGQTIKERFNTEYRELYNGIIALVRVDHEEIVKLYESWLIEYFYNHPKCDNLQIVGGSRDSSSGSYILYVVYKD